MADPTSALDPQRLLHAPPLPLHSPVDLLALVESYRTGILLLDGILVLLVPIVIQQLILVVQHEGDSSVSVFATLLALLWPQKDDERIERTIELTQRYRRDGYKVWDYEQKNHLLQKAISQYLSDVLNLHGKDAKYELLDKPTDQIEEFSDDGRDGGSDDECDDESEVDKLQVKPLPLINTWIEVEKGVLFKHEVVTPGDAGENRVVSETKIIYRLSSTLADGSDRIEGFIARAFAKYQEEQRRKVKEDRSRYFYIQSGTKTSGTDENQQVVAYKRYALGEEKTFENLFFDEKRQVLQLLDNFAAKTGKFAIKGFPYKLGFLLHGPPGTGKTSLIKAIAQYTKRHIVTINLGKIKSNQELMDAVFDLKFAVDGLDSPVEYTFKDVIFVMEDIDCASSIVNKREVDPEKGPPTESEVSASDLDGSANKLLRAVSTQGAKTGDTAKSDDEKLVSMMIKMVMDDEKKHAKLNLAGLLNVLDGVIDCPGRMIVMTTNHPEKLDPALIRPGRVNKNLLLSYMNATQVCQMIEYYTMHTLNGEQMARIHRVFETESKLVSPAEVEEMCAEYDATDKIVEALEKVAFGSRS